MSLSSERIKKQILKAIGINPTEISIKQVSKVEVDGYLDEKEIIKNLTVLIYKENNRADIKINTGTIGTSYSNKQYSMIADYAANLETNPKESIQFDCREGYMKIKAVYPIVIKGTICGYECDLERIN